MGDGARRAGRAIGRRRAEHPGEDEWPELRRAVLAGGGIGPSRDWDSDSWPGDLFRAHGKAPDLVAVETTIGRSDSPPWGEGDDNTMHRYLERAHSRHRQLTGEEKGRRAEEEEAPPARRAGSHLGRRQQQERESRAHEERMSAFVRQARAARAAAPRAPAIGFYTDRKDVVHPIVARRAGRAYALRRGR